MSKLLDQLQGAERERIEREKSAEQVAGRRANAGKPPALDEPLKLGLDPQLSSYKA